MPRSRSEMGELHRKIAFYESVREKATQRYKTKDAHYEQIIVGLYASLIEKLDNLEIPPYDQA